jgi:hypothetical protein
MTRNNHHKVLAAPANQIPLSTALTKIACCLQPLGKHLLNEWGPENNTPSNAILTMALVALNLFMISGAPLPICLLQVTLLLGHYIILLKGLVDNPERIYEKPKPPKTRSEALIPVAVSAVTQVGIGYALLGGSFGEVLANAALSTGASLCIASTLPAPVVSELVGVGLLGLGVGQLWISSMFSDACSQNGLSLAISPKETHDLKLFISKTCQPFRIKANNEAYRALMNCARDIKKENLGLLKRLSDGIWGLTYEETQALIRQLCYTLPQRHP